MRYKGRKSEMTLAHDFPHCVEIVVPPGSFGRTLDQMHERLRGIAHVRGRGRRDKSRNSIVNWYTKAPVRFENAANWCIEVEKII
jgi:hypothetical protein